jgi:class 3 adenylate cyclase
MADLTAKERAQLPDSAFAYINSVGRRSLPIHDERHVRNALARFDRVVFDDEADRDRARRRLLRAARRFGIAFDGFVDGQMRPTRLLPTGRVPLLMTDVEGSTEHVAVLGEGYSELLNEVRRLIRTPTRRNGGHEVDARADELFAVFKLATSAVEAAIAIQRAMSGHRWPGARTVRVRIGLHTGRPTLTTAGYVGLAVNTVSRIAAAGHGGQIVVSQAVRQALGEEVTDVRLGELGVYPLRGIPDPVELYGVLDPGLPAQFPPLRL